MNSIFEKQKYRNNKRHKSKETIFRQIFSSNFRSNSSGKSLKCRIRGEEGRLQITEYKQKTDYKNLIRVIHFFLQTAGAESLLNSEQWYGFLTIISIDETLYSFTIQLFYSTFIQRYIITQLTYNSLLFLFFSLN